MNAIECYEELFAYRCELMVRKFNFAPTGPGDFKGVQRTLELAVRRGPPQTVQITLEEGGDGSVVACSNIGIACQPQATLCLRSEAAEEKKPPN